MRLGKDLRRAFERLDADVDFDETVKSEILSFLENYNMNELRELVGEDIFKCCLYDAYESEV